MCGSLYELLVVRSGAVRSIQRCSSSGAAQMVSGGNDGYGALGEYDPLASVSGPHNSWMDSGIKGALASWERIAVGP